MNVLWQVALLSLVLASAAGQRYNISDFADFTKSPTENLIVILDQPFLVQSVEGVVTFEDDAGQPLPGALVEIEGPGAIKKIFHTMTDRTGHFKINHTRGGTYKFKVTLNGFSSVAGAIVVSKKDPKVDQIKIAMGVGN